MEAIGAGRNHIQYRVDDGLRLLAEYGMPGGQANHAALC